MRFLEGREDCRRETLGHGGNKREEKGKQGHWGFLEKDPTFSCKSKEIPTWCSDHKTSLIFRWISLGMATRWIRGRFFILRLHPVVQYSFFILAPYLASGQGGSERKKFELNSFKIN